MLWVLYDNNTFATFTEEKSDDEKFGSFNRVLFQDFSGKEFKNNQILGLNVKAFRPVMFMWPNIVTTFMIKYAPFRMIKSYNLPFYDENGQREDSSYEMIKNSYRNEVIQT